MRQAQKARCFHVDIMSNIPFKSAPALWACRQGGDSLELLQSGFIRSAHEAHEGMQERDTTGLLHARTCSSPAARYQVRWPSL